MVPLNRWLLCGSHLRTIIKFGFIKGLLLLLLLLLVLLLLLLLLLFDVRCWMLMMGLYLSSLRLDIKGVTLVVSLGWQSPIGRREVGPIWWPHGSVLFFLWDSGMNFQFFF